MKFKDPGDWLFGASSSLFQSLSVWLSALAACLAENPVWFSRARLFVPGAVYAPVVF